MILLGFSGLDLTGHLDFRNILEALGRGVLVPVIEGDRDTGLGNTGLALLVDQFLEVGDTGNGEGLEPQDEQDGVHDVGLAGTVESSNGVELLVEVSDDGSLGVGLESF